MIGIADIRSPAAFSIQVDSDSAFIRACATVFPSLHPHGRISVSPSNIISAFNAASLEGFRQALVSTANTPFEPTTTWSMFQSGNGTSWKTRYPWAIRRSNSRPTTCSPFAPSRYSHDFLSLRRSLRPKTLAPPVTKKNTPALMRNRLRSGKFEQRSPSNGHPSIINSRSSVADSKSLSALLRVDSPARRRGLSVNGCLASVS